MSQPDNSKIYTKNEIFEWMLRQPVEIKASLIEYLKFGESSDNFDTFKPAAETPQNNIGKIDGVTNRDLLVTQIVNGDNKELRRRIWQGGDKMWSFQRHLQPADGHEAAEGLQKDSFAQITNYVHTQNIDEVLYQQYGKGKPKEEFQTWLGAKAKIKYGTQLYKSDEELTEELKSVLDNTYKSAKAKTALYSCREWRRPSVSGLIVFCDFREPDPPH